MSGGSSGVVHCEISFAAAQRCNVLCVQLTLTYLIDTTCTDSVVWYEWFFEMCNLSSFYSETLKT